MGIRQFIQENLKKRDWNVPDLVRRSDKLTDKAVYAAIDRDSAGVQVVTGLAEGFDVSTDEVLGRTLAVKNDVGVPVVGTVQAGDEGYWDELQYPVGHGDGFIRYPSRDRNAYALRVKGDSMRPRIKPGEFIIALPPPNDRHLLRRVFCCL